MSRRWLVRAVAGLLLVLLCVRLGMWQLDRNEERSARNDIIQANEEAPPAQLEEVLGPNPASAQLDEADQWRSVELRGRYDTEHEMLLRLRPLEGRRGFHVITPLVTDDGAAILVDRGFYVSDDDDPSIPAPPAGQVTVTARLRTTENQRDAGDVTGGRIRYVNVEQIAEALPYPLVPAWAEAVEPAGEDLVALPQPEADLGPHLSYALQWFIFAVVGVTGFVLLIRAEARGRGPEPPEAVADDDADESTPDGADDSARGVDGSGTQGSVDGPARATGHPRH